MTLISSPIATEIRAAIPTVHYAFDDRDMFNTPKLLTLLTRIVSDLECASEPQKLVWIST